MAIRNIKNLGLVFAAVLLIVAGMSSCSQAEEAAETQEGTKLEKNQIAIEGTVKLVVGQYVFVPEVRGFDIVIAPDRMSGDPAELLDKEVKGMGQFSPEWPSILVPVELEVKDEGGDFTPVITPGAEEGEEGPAPLELDDYMSTADRDEFEALEGLEYNKKVGWEDKEKVKLRGRFESTEDGDRIIVLDEEGEEVGSVIVDSMTDFADYYIKKLRLFDEFWFYVNIKETVDWSTRRRTRELFHADVLFAGLF